MVRGVDDQGIPGQQAVLWKIMSFGESHAGLWVALFQAGDDAKFQVEICARKNREGGGGIYAGVYQT